MKIELNKTEIDILLNGLLALNHRLINDLVKTEFGVKQRKVYDLRFPIKETK